MNRSTSSVDPAANAPGWAAAVAEILGGVALGVALASSFNGPLRLEAFGGSLSVRTLARPLLVAGAMLVARAWLDGRHLRIATVAGSAGRMLLGGVAAAGVIGWVVFLSTTCGGADSYGYVSAAGRVLSGTLIQHEPLARLLPIADAIAAATPLGYTPSVVVPEASVPIYPLGLPALMAAAVAVGGADAAFVVAPLSAVLLLASLGVLTQALTGSRLAALAAVALGAVHPVVFTYSIQPMSDVPAAACFVTALTLLVWGSGRPARGGARGDFLAVCAGVFAAACLLIRPALGPGLLALGVVPTLVRHDRAGRAAVFFLVPLAAGVLLQLALQWHLYGHPLANGYADVGTLFSAERFLANLRSHGYWAWRALGPAAIGAVAIGLVVGSRVTRRLVGVVAAAVAAPYLVYRVFDHWETLRFLLPALVLLIVPAAVGLTSAARRVAGAGGAPLVTAVMVLGIAYGSASWLRVNQVFAMPEHETRYRRAGELVQQVAPPGAVVLAQLHSGSVRYYGRRQSANWERIPPGALPASIAALQRAGHPVFLLIDGEEERLAFESRHGSIGGWLPGGQRRTVQLLEAPPAAGRTPQ